MNGNSAMFELKRVQESYEKMIEPKEVPSATIVKEDAEADFVSAGGDADDFDIPVTEHHYVIFKKWMFPDYMIKGNPTLHKGDFEVAAWFPKESMVFGKNDGHGDCDNEIIRAWPDATPEEYADTLDYMKKHVYLEKDGDFLHVVKSEYEIDG